MLWVIPLALYLVAFILAYARRRLVSPTVAGTALAVLAVVVVLTMLGVLSLPLWGLLALQYGMFFSAALVAATLLADDRPATDHLTGYYLLIALGGVLGGAFSGLVAPALFNSTLEYPVGLLLAVALIPPLRRAPFEAPSPAARRRPWPDDDPGSGSAPATWTCSAPAPGDSSSRSQAALPLQSSCEHGRSAWRSPWAASWQSPTWPNRHRCTPSGPSTGSTGSSMTPTAASTSAGPRFTGRRRRPLADRRQALTYYHPDGPMGDLFARLRETQPTRPSSVGLVGLGAGELAAYAQSGEQWRFYEIDPAVIQIARGSGLFTLSVRCPGRGRHGGGGWPIAAGRGAAGLDGSACHRCFRQRRDPGPPPD